MPTRFHPIPDSLLQLLGQATAWPAWQQALRRQELELPDLRAPASQESSFMQIPGPQEPRLVRLSDQGLDLMLQCLNPERPSEQYLWGLQALIFHTALSDPLHYWKGAWPANLQPEAATAASIVSLYAEDDDDAVLMHDAIVCFEVPSFEGRRMVVQCLFDLGSKTLLTLSLIRGSEWKPMSEILSHQ